MNRLWPMQPVPELTARTVTGGLWNVHDQHPQRFTLLVFYRGWHCSTCKNYLQTLDRLAADFRDLGVEPFAVSGDPVERALESQRDWRIENVSLGYNLPVRTMAEWGLFLSRAVRVIEPEVFCEPALFVIRPDQTLYFSVINSSPFGRPHLQDLLRSLEWIIEEDYPARGECDPLDFCSSSLQDPRAQRSC
jgi:peroxiredoxin